MEKCKIYLALLFKVNNLGNKIIKDYKYGHLS